MVQRLSALAFALSSVAAGAWTSLANSFRVRIAGDARSYRPERHYMRGPGPQWRAKHLLGRNSV